jgi:hypothetical protein
MNAVSFPGQSAGRTRRRVDVQHPHGDGAIVAEAVLDAGGRQHEGSRRRHHRAVAEGEGHLPLDDVEGVVLAVVHVLLEHAPDGDFDDREREPRRVDRAREELHVPHAMALAGRDDDEFTVHVRDPVRVVAWWSRGTSSPCRWPWCSP